MVGKADGSCSGICLIALRKARQGWWLSGERRWWCGGRRLVVRSNAAECVEEGVLHGIGHCLAWESAKQAASAAELPEGCDTRGARPQVSLGALPHMVRQGSIEIIVQELRYVTAGRARRHRRSRRSPPGRRAAHFSPCLARGGGSPSDWSARGPTHYRRPPRSSPRRRGA
jgi:hypothetical protein